MEAAPPLKEGWTTVDVSTVSADTLIGADIQNYDQDTVASIKDVLLTPDGKVKNVVAQFGGFLGFGDSTVLLGMDEINVAKDADGNLVVLTSLTPDDLKGRPEYTPDNTAEPVADAGPGRPPLAAAAVAFPPTLGPCAARPASPKPVAWPHLPPASSRPPSTRPTSTRPDASTAISSGWKR